MCEMGVDLIICLYENVSEGKLVFVIVVGLEVIGFGINCLNGMVFNYFIFNWDDLLVKEGLYNRYMVGLSVW